MKNQLIIVVSALIFIGCSWVIAGTTNGFPRKVLVKKEWRGQTGLNHGIKSFGVISDFNSVKQLWDRWKVNGNPPLLDFKKDLIIYLDVRSSGVDWSPTVDAMGNLDLHGAADPDHPPCVSFVIGVIDRDGIRTLNNSNIDHATLFNDTDKAAQPSGAADALSGRR